MILVDTNILLDIAEDDPLWGDRSLRHLESAAKRDEVAINPVIYAEFSVGYERIEEVEAVLRAISLQVLPLPREALFLAGKAFRNYRQRGGTKVGVLPDFFIGAHAAVSNMPLLTRDASRYRSYFPALTLIAPE
ncbi:MAG: type II toxin-antitoxin system VapC family toxin [Rhodocyclaceae bacterium]|nr:type II toxin-antitoxin system VapC family toxin [Rhodocyclaceae bacterium]